MKPIALTPARLLRILALGAILLAFPPSAAPAAAQPPDPHLSADERQTLIDELEGSKAELDDIVSQILGNAWTYKPSPDRWSPGEVAEHLLLAEGALFDQVQKAMQADPDPEWAATQELTFESIVDQLGDRSQKLQAPEGLRPKGEMSRATLLDKFTEARDRTLQFVRETDAPLKEHTVDNPLFGKINAAQLLAFIAGHNYRHNQQIQEAAAVLE